PGTQLAGLAASLPTWTGTLTAPPMAPAAAETTVAPRHEVAFVDSSVQNYQQLVRDLQSQNGPGRQLDGYVLDGKSDGAQQIADILAGYRNLDAVHIFSHGTDGAFHLGDAWLTPDSLPAHADEFRAWAPALAANGDVLIYGCDVAATDAGRQLLQNLS